VATYAWTIDKLYTKDIVLDGTTYTDVILRVEATLTGTSETIGSISSNGSFDLDMDVTGINSSFTEYASVTEANVKTWVENRVGSATINEIKLGIEGEIDFLEKTNGSVAKEDTDGNSTFPWS
jgi:hypothetical protein